MKTTKDRALIALIVISLLVAVIAVIIGTQQSKGKDADATPTITLTSTATASDLTGDGKVVKIVADMPKAPAGLEKFYDQDVTWEACGSNTCAYFKVPLDYTKPDGEEIQVFAEKRAAGNGKPIGTLFLNPGGPGGSGAEFLASAETTFSQDILDNFDLIGFDPRGVGKSTAVDCIDDAELGILLDKTYPTSDAGLEESKQDIIKLGEGCRAKTGNLIDFVGTESAARDMDVMRQVVGDPKLYYVGYSYGTMLGGMYADLFPHNVGRLILDGAVDTAITSTEQTYEQIMGFEQATDAYLTDCLTKDSCPFKGKTVAEARAQLKAKFVDIEKNPVPTANPNRPLTQSSMFTGFIVPLYDDTAWNYLSTALTELFEKNDGSTLQFFADLNNSRDMDGTFSSNMVEANWAINCADLTVVGDMDDWKAAAEKLAKDAPLFGDMMGYGEQFCKNWPYQPGKDAGPFVAKGSEPIVVVGTTGDPATPYKWSQEFEKDLDNAVLVTWEGEGHTAYGRSTNCISDPLDEYLLNGTVPEDGLTCPAK